MKVLVLNGPNLNLLGVREPAHYGRETYRSLVGRIRRAARSLGMRAVCYQSNHEGALVDKIQSARLRFDGIIFNPGAYTHTSIALLDALKSVGLPCVEVHISKVEEREEFRKISYIRPACFASVIGHGTDGYLEALSLLKERLEAVK